MSKMKRFCQQLFVIPAEAGIQEVNPTIRIPAFAGMTLNFSSKLNCLFGVCQKFDPGKAGFKITERD
jgi:hypothetical protein